MKIDEIKCELQALLRRVDKSVESAGKVASVCNIIDASWSGSNLVGHVDLFYKNFDVPSYRDRFDIEWGLIDGVPDGWQERNNAEIFQKIESDSGVSLEELNESADSIATEFERLRRRSIIAFSEFSKESAREIEQFSIQTKIDIFNQYWKRRIITRDSRAAHAGSMVPTHKFYGAAASFITSVTEQINELLYLVDKVFAQNKSMEYKDQGHNNGRIAYVDKNTLLRLSRIENQKFDLSRLVSFCNELDDNYSLGNYHSCAMLIRAILDHVPPIFEKTKFDDICAHHGGRSFKDIIKPLGETAKKIGDDYLHTQISKKVLAVTKTQVSFQANLDILLNEVAAILERK